MGEKNPEQETLKAPKPFAIVTLQDPLESDIGEMLETIKIKRPVARDLMAMDSKRGEVAKMISLISRLAKLPEAIIKKMDGGDFSAIKEVIEDFLAPSQ